MAVCACAEICETARVVARASASDVATSSSRAMLGSWGAAAGIEGSVGGAGVRPDLPSAGLRDPSGSREGAHMVKPDTAVNGEAETVLCEATAPSAGCDRLPHAAAPSAWPHAPEEVRQHAD